MHKNNQISNYPNFHSFPLLKASFIPSPLISSYLLHFLFLCLPSIPFDSIWFHSIPFDSIIDSIRFHFIQFIRFHLIPFESIRIHCIWFKFCAIPLGHLASINVVQFHLIPSIQDGSFSICLVYLNCT